MRYAYLLPLAAAGALAYPPSDACLAAVTGKAALGDDSLRSAHCASFLHTTVTPEAVTTTVTVTGTKSGKNGWKRATVTYCPNEVPNYASACDEAAYTSACAVIGITDISTTTLAPTTTTKTVYVHPTGECDGTVTETVTEAGETATVTDAGKTTTVTDAGKTVTDAGKTVTEAGKTVTEAGKTVTEAGKTVTEAGKTVTEAGKTVTVSGGRTATVSTVTVTEAGKTVTVSGGRTATVTTVTVTESGVHSASVTTLTVTETVTDHQFPSKSSTTSTSPTPTVDPTCLTDDKAVELVDAFVNFLEFTSYPGGPKGAKGRGYNMTLSNLTLTPDFVDISDSINFMAGFDLGSITFPVKAAFDRGQGVEQPEVLVDVLNIWHDCHSITWRWKITPFTPFTAYPVVGINYMLITDDFKIKKNYAEFSNGAWLQSFNQKCALTNATIKVVPNALKRATLPPF